VADRDLAVIDAATRTVVNEVTGVGTLNSASPHPVTGDVWVANTDARNLVPSPTCAARSSQPDVDRGSNTGTVNAVHLNPHVDYGVAPGWRDRDLAQPTDVRFLPAARRPSSPRWLEQGGVSTGRPRP
jgi:hypothetical protein